MASLSLIALLWVLYAAPWLLYTRGDAFAADLTSFSGVVTFVLVAIALPMLVILPAAHLTLSRLAARMRGPEAARSVRALVLASARSYLLCTVPCVLVIAYRDRHGTHGTSLAVLLIVTVALAVLTWPIWKRLEPTN